MSVDFGENCSWCGLPPSECKCQEAIDKYWEQWRCPLCGKTAEECEHIKAIENADEE